MIVAAYVANRQGDYVMERRFVGVLVLAMAATVFYGVLKLKQMQADYDLRLPAKDESSDSRARRKHIVWWISYRGEGKTGVDNIGVFEDDGTPRKKHPLLLDPSPDAHPLHIARGFALVGDDLYIANAWRKDSHVARYRRHGDTFHFADVVVTTKHVSAMVHPFDVELGDDGRLYVSCQDTNTVVAILPKTRKPAPVAPHLRKTFPERKLPSRHAGRLQPGPASRSAATARRWTCRRRRASRWCSTSTASPGTRCAASSCTASISTWRTRRATSSRSSR